MPDVLDDQLTSIVAKDVSAGQYSFQHQTDKIVMPPNAATELLDIDIDTMGKRKKRKGYSTIGDDVGSAAIAAMVGFFPTGGSRQILMEANGTVYKWTGSGNWTSSQAGLTAQNPSELVIGKNLAFRLSQTDNVRSFDGTSWTDEGDTNTDFPKSKMALYTSTQRMLAANSTASPHFLYYSGSGDPQTWDRTTDAFKIGSNEGDGVTGLIEFTNQEVMAFTKNSMTLLKIGDATPGNWTQAKVADIGCVAYRTVKLFGEDALFLADDGVRSVAQSAQDKKRGTSLPVSFPIQDWVERINWPAVDKAVAWVWQDKYYLAVPIDTSTTNNYVFVFSRRAFEANGNRGGWAIYSNVNANAFAVQNFSTTNKLYFGESTADSLTYFFRSADPTDEATNDNTTAITYSETGRAFDFDAPQNEKTFEVLEVEALSTGGTLTVQAQIDEGGFTTLGTMDLSGSLPTLPISLPFDLVGANVVRQKFDLENLGRGRTIQIKLTEATVDQEVEILGYSITAFVENIEMEGA